MATTKKPVSPETLSKLEEGYRYITIPATDIYDQPVAPFRLNHLEFAPGTHLVSAEIADTLEERLRVWNTSLIRLMRPTVNQETAKVMAKQGVYLGQAPPQSAE